MALTWFWVALALAMGVALLLWPYQRGCGLQLIFYLGAAGVTAVIALLGALASWSHRRGFAHVLSLLVMVWAGFIVLREVLAARRLRQDQPRLDVRGPAGGRRAGGRSAPPGGASASADALTYPHPSLLGSYGQDVPQFHRR